jgi:hypothetical protein
MVRMEGNVMGQIENLSVELCHGEASGINYNLEGGCGFIEICSDMRKLRDSEAMGMVDENLADQYFELCSVDGNPRCLLADRYNAELRNDLGVE